MVLNSSCMHFFVAHDDIAGCKVCRCWVCGVACWSFFKTRNFHSQTLALEKHWPLKINEGKGEDFQFYLPFQTGWTTLRSMVTEYCSLVTYKNGGQLSEDEKKEKALLHSCKQKKQIPSSTGEWDLSVSTPCCMLVESVDSIFRTSWMTSCEGQEWNCNCRECGGKSEHTSWEWVLQQYSFDSFAGRRLVEKGP